MKKHQFKREITIFAFSLADVLITLGIIGVVASMTMPTLIQNYQKTQYASQLKKIYSEFSQAYNLIIMDAGGSILNNPNFNCSESCNYSEAAKAMDEFAEKIKVIRNCGLETGCWHESPIKCLGGTANYLSKPDSEWANQRGKAILVDGTMVMVGILDNSCAYNPSESAVAPMAKSVCGWIQVDLNGKSPPNTYGRDFFDFWITVNGIYPVGIFNDGTNCQITSSIEKTSAGCTAKVLQEGSMNY